MIECGSVKCAEYTGDVPEGYDSLDDWFSRECENLYRWRIVGGNLTVDPDKEEPKKCEPFGIYKLWQNPNPKESFSPATISMDLAGYAGITVCFKGVASGSGRYASGFIPVGAGAYIQCHAMNGDLRQRYVKVTETGVAFEDGYNIDTVNDSFAIPVTIYGFSGLVDKTVESDAVY